MRRLGGVDYQRRGLIPEPAGRRLLEAVQNRGGSRVEIARFGLIEFLRFDQQVSHHVEQRIQVTDRGVVKVRRSGRIFFCHSSNIGNERVTKCSRLFLDLV